MDIPIKKLKNGFSMPVLGFGTWKIGGDQHRNPNNDDLADIKAIQQAIEAGLTHIDTAEAYAEGHAEELVGKAIQNYDRSSLFIVSKVIPDNQSRDLLLQSLQASLTRLGTNYLDLYLLHQPSKIHPIEETMSALDEAKDQGLIKNIGVSNFTIKQLEKAQSLTENKIVVNQLHLNLKIREAEKMGLIEHAQKNDWMFVAWRPLQKGMLIKKTSPVLSKMAKKYSKTPAQISLNWLISQKNIVTLSKMSNSEHLQENLGALNWQLEDSDIEILRREFPHQELVSDSVPLEEWGKSINM